MSKPPRLTGDEIEEIREELAGSDAIVDAHLTARVLLAELDAESEDLATEASRRRVLEVVIGDATVALTTLFPEPNAEKPYRVDAPANHPLVEQAIHVRSESLAWQRRALAAETGLQAALAEQVRLHRERAEPLDDNLSARARVRPEVLAFAKLMEKKLRENDRKGGWQREAPEYLLYRIREETKELESIGGSIMAAFLRHGERRDDPAHKSTRADEIGAECADIANFAMMIADNAGALKG